MNESGYRIYLRWPDGQQHWQRPRLDAALRGGSMPYHPIASLGMHRRLPPTSLGLKWWPVCAPLLEDAWNYCATGSLGEDIEQLADHLRDAGRRLGHWLDIRSPRGMRASLHGHVPRTVAQQIVVAARDSGTLSCAQSMAVAQSFLHTPNGAVPLLTLARTERKTTVEANYTREGNTSTVLHVSVPINGKTSSFALNVARDTTDAAADLAAASRQLAHWAQTGHGLAASVLGTGCGSTRWFGQEVEVSVAVVEWIADSHEMHAIPIDQSGYGRLVEVDRFEHAINGAQSMTTRQVSDERSDALWAAVVRTRAQLAQPNWRQGIITAPAIELNDGDMVSVPDADGTTRAVLVACGAQPWQGAIGVWPYELCLPSGSTGSGNPEDRIWWGHPELAVRALQDVLNMSTIDKSSQDQRLWEEALRVDITRVFQLAAGAPRKLVAAAFRAVQEHAHKVLGLR